MQDWLHMSLQVYPKLALGLVATASLVIAEGPCDIFATGGTNCVAAHSTTRSLFESYTGPLYQVMRGSDSLTANIYPRWPGGVANANDQDNFCWGTTCLISIIYDQSGHNNHLTQAPPGGATAGPSANGYDNLASAIGAPVTVGGQKAYGVFISPGTGYRIDNTTGIAIGNEPEGIYELTDGTHYNHWCCYDYGNAEVTNTDNGNGHMEALFFGNGLSDPGSGNGPWIMADMENGLFSGISPTNNPTDPSIPWRFVHAIVKGEANHWAIRGANAVEGPVLTFYDGPRPDKPGYNPMHKEGAIILGIGGDNSDGGQGTFYEGVMTFGYPSSEIDDRVQANIVAARYATAPLISGQSLRLNELISFKAIISPNEESHAEYYVAHNGSAIELQDVSYQSSRTEQEQASWVVRPGFGNTGCFSFESVDAPGSYIVHLSNFQLILGASNNTVDFDNNKDFSEASTFCPQTSIGNQGGYSSIRSWDYPTRYWRTYNGLVYAASNGGPQDFDNSASFIAETTFMITNGFF